MQADSIFIFTGPTLSPQTGQKHLDASYLPPVKYGDIYRLVELYQPQVIGIIDGYFNQVPAVWHKEILWAIDQGIAVFGAASMGALRAAELDQYGMTGCGEIFKAYQCGLLPPFNTEPFEDDDEVAVIHSPAELGYIAASEAMVNIRFSFAQAVRQGVIDRASCLAFAKIAKSLFYADRKYSTIFEQAAQQSIAVSTISNLKTWLETNAVDQKQMDAITLLKAINEHIKNPPTHQMPGIEPFQHTSQWQSAIDEIAQSHTIDHPALGELRVAGPAYFETLDAALTSFLPDQAAPNPAGENLLELHRSPEKLHRVFSQRWQSKQNQLISSHLTHQQCEQILLKHLEQTKQIGTYEARAKDKLEKRSSLKQPPVLDNLSEIDKLQLTDWYFTQQLKLEMPNELDDYAFDLGFADLDSFYAMILDEYLYQDART